MTRSAIVIYTNDRLKEKHELEPETRKVVELMVRGANGNLLRRTRGLKTGHGKEVKRRERERLLMVIRKTYTLFPSGILVWALVGTGWERFVVDANNGWTIAVRWT